MQSQKLALPLHPQSGNKPVQKACEADMKKKLKTYCKKFLKNLADWKSWSIFAVPNETSGFRWWKKIEKSSWKIWWIEKVELTLQPESVNENWSVFSERVLWITGKLREKKCSIYLSFPLRKVNSQALTKHNIFLLWRVWSWLRMNASGRLNTCKSRGIAM